MESADPRSASQAQTGLVDPEAVQAYAGAVEVREKALRTGFKVGAVEVLDRWTRTISLAERHPSAFVLSA